MPESLKELRKNREQSWRYLPRTAVVGALGTGGLGVLYLLGGRYPPWVWALLLAVVWFQFLGDYINIWYLNCRIAAAERDELA